MLPENQPDNIVDQNNSHNLFIDNISENWKEDKIDMLQKENNIMLSDQKAVTGNSIISDTYEKFDDSDCVHENLLKTKLPNEKNYSNFPLKNGSSQENAQLIQNLDTHKIVKPCLSDDSCKSLIDAARVTVGPHGQVLVREDTVVAGCTTCSGVRLISCAKIKCTTSTLCWQRTSKKPSNVVLGGLIFLTLFSLIGTIIFCFTNLFSTTILSNLIIKNNSMAYHVWKNPPVRPLMKVHIFNYTNAEEIMSGTATKIKVEDIGPYTYSETLSNVNEVFHPNGTISFQTKRSYQFVPSESVGAQFDKVFVPNLPLLSAVSMARESHHILQAGFSFLLSGLGVKPFRILPIHRFLWGYEDDLINLAKPYLKLRGEMPYDNFGVLVTKNGTSPDIITINTGENNLDLIGVIENYNGKNKLEHWGTDECNRVDALGGSMFPVSMLDRKQTLHVFNNELCRKFPFVYEKDVKAFNDIPALRYTPPKTVFDHPSTNSLNQCYCHIDSGVCPPKGLFNSSPCVYGAPAFASFPHYYLGDQILLEAIDGLKPDAEKHSSFIDVHPQLGIPLRASSKMQINIQVRKANGITVLNSLPDELFLPVAWIEIAITELPQEIKTLIYHVTFSAHQAQLVLIWGCIITLLISGTFLLMAVRAKLSSG